MTVQLFSCRRDGLSQSSIRKSKLRTELIHYICDEELWRSILSCNLRESLFPMHLIFARQDYFSQIHPCPSNFLSRLQHPRPKWSARDSRHRRPSQAHFRHHCRREIRSHNSDRKRHHKAQHFRQGSTHQPRGLQHPHPAWRRS